jgi:hypothetical protein
MADLSPQELATFMDGISGALATESIDTNSSNKAIAIIGEPKTGKSWLAATIAEAVGVTYFFDLDDRKDSIAGKKNVIAKTYVDLIQSQPRAFKEMEKDIERFKYNKVSGKPIPAAFVVDSVTFLKRIVENEFFEQMKNSTVKMFREVKLDGTNNTVRIPEGWDAINGVRDYCLYLFAELRALGHLIVIFHERPLTDKALSTPAKPVYTGKIGVDPPFLNNLLTVFNDVWRIILDPNGSYKVFVKANANFNGSTSLQGLDMVENPNIAAMLQKNAAAIAKR